MNKLEKKVIQCLNEDIKAPYEVAQELRMKRKMQLLKLKNALNELYANDVIDTIKVNGEKKIYVKTM